MRAKLLLFVWKNVILAVLPQSKWHQYYVLGQLIARVRNEILTDNRKCFHLENFIGADNGI